jgi:hypothetical protein
MDDEYDELLKHIKKMDIFRSRFDGNILIAGATSFIGSSILIRLLEETDISTIYISVRSNKLDNGESVWRNFVNRRELGEYFFINDRMKRLKIINIDASKENDSWYLQDMDTTNIKYIINCIGKHKFQTDIEENEENIKIVNSLFPVRLLKIFSNCERFIQLSFTYCRVNRKHTVNENEGHDLLYSDGNQYLKDYKMLSLYYKSVGEKMLYKHLLKPNPMINISDRNKKITKIIIARVGIPTVSYKFPTSGWGTFMGDFHSYISLLGSNSVKSIKSSCNMNQIVDFAPVDLISKRIISMFSETINTRFSIFEFGSKSCFGLQMSMKEFIFDYIVPRFKEKIEDNGSTVFHIHKNKILFKFHNLCNCGQSNEIVTQFEKKYRFLNQHGVLTGTNHNKQCDISDYVEILVSFLHAEIMKTSM